jgi:hypothetical protein
MTHVGIQVLALEFARRMPRASTSVPVAALGHHSVIAGAIAFVLSQLVWAASLSPSTLVGSLVVLIAAMAAAAAVLFGGARLLLPGEVGRTWLGVALAMLAGASLVRGWAPDAFPQAFLVGIVGLHLLANLVATARVRREPYLDAGLRRWQLAAVWMLPALGVLLVSAYYRAQDDPSSDDAFDRSGTTDE